jgi:hypothetical protein
MAIDEASEDDAAFVTGASGRPSQGHERPPIGEHRAFGRLEEATGGWLFIG